MKLKEKGTIFRTGFAIVMAGIILILFYYFVNNPGDMGNGIDAVLNAIAPFLVGAVMAYIMCPVQNFFTKKLYAKFSQKSKTHQKALFKSKLISMIISLIILIGIVIGFFSLLVPSLIDTVSHLVEVLPKQVEDFMAWFQDNVVKTHPVWAERLGNVLSETQDSIIAWAKQSFLPAAGTLVSGLYSGVAGVVTVVIDVAVGFIACIYFLLDKEHFIAQVKKIVAAIFKPETANKIFNLCSTAHRIFGGFINGKILTSLFVGLILFGLMMLFGLPYAALSATIVGVLNIIPFFGPFLGAIPPVLLLVLDDPIEALIFLILVVAVQSLDQYVLSPKIIGSNTGLSSFWVMFAILVFGSLFGFVGMVLGVPVFALIYTYFAEFVSKRLAKKKLPEDTEVYKDYAPYGIENQKEFKEEILHKEVTVEPGVKDAGAKEEAKRTTAKETTKKAGAKKTTAKKPAAKKTTAKKPTAKKTTTKKTTAKKSTAKKTTTNKSAAKKTTKK